MTSECGQHSVPNICVDSINSTKMAFKLVVLSALLAVANAGYLGAPGALSYAAPAHVGYAAPAHVGYAAPAVSYAHAPVASTAVGSQTQSVYRSHDGNHAVSTYTKAVDTAFSSVRKYDTRVSNDAIAYAPAIAHAPVAYASHAAYTGHAYAAPAYAAHAPAVAYSAPAAHGGLLGVAYSAAPAVAHISYANGHGYGYHY